MVRPTEIKPLIILEQKTDCGCGCGCRLSEPEQVIVASIEPRRGAAETKRCDCGCGCCG